MKHNGPLTGHYAVSERALPAAIVEYVSDHDLELDSFASAEAQVAAISDDIAYNSHDIDDGLRAGLFDLGDLRELPLVGPAFAAVQAEYGEIDRPRFIHVGISQIIGAMVADVLTETRRRITESDVDSPEAVRALDHAVVGLSDEIAEADRAVKAFLYENMYRHHRVNRMTSKARRVVSAMFELLFDEPELLPTAWRARAQEKDEHGRARVIADYIAGMTDRYALELHRKLFDPEVV